MSVSEIRTQVYLTQSQHAGLKRAARQRGVSLAQLVRESVDAYLARSADEVRQVATAYDAGLRSDRSTASTHSDDDPIWSLPTHAQELALDGPGDAARNHDDYLYGPRTTP